MQNSRFSADVKLKLKLASRREMNTSLLICAGMLANSGLLAKVDRFSTASRSGVVATRHLFLFSSEKSASEP